MGGLPGRDVVLLLGSIVLASLPVGYLQVVLPLYLNRVGLAPSLIGLLYSLSGLVTALLVAFSGALADRFGRRGFLVRGTALPMACSQSWVRRCVGHLGPRVASVAPRIGNGAYQSPRSRRLSRGCVSCLTDRCQ